MRLKGGARILAGHPDELLDRVSLSNGTRDVTATVEGSATYAQGARVPCEPWLKPAAEDILRLYAKRENYAPGDVWLREVPGNLMRQFDSLGTAQLHDQGEVQRVKATTEYAACTKAALEWVCEGPVPLDSTSRIIGMAVKLPGLTTVTVNQQSGSRTGLHLDFWDRKPLDQVTATRVRCNINLGTEDRQFLFLNLPVPVLLDEVAFDSPYDGSRLGRCFLEKHSDYPITRLRVKPGEAYFAMTDLLIHDATTMNRQTPDVTFTILGDFRP